uniref:Uncharacterized protein n=1 Tax=Heterorhabditis bacteriophora TaxID=37862 RepID=A0A1I7WIP5_HETBA
MGDMRDEFYLIPTEMHKNNIHSNLFLK